MGATPPGWLNVGADSGNVGLPVFNITDANTTAYGDSSGSVPGEDLVSLSFIVSTARKTTS